MEDDIRHKMPIESIDYDILTEEWKEISTKMYKDNNLFRACYSKCMFLLFLCTNHIKYIIFNYILCIFKFYSNN